METAEFVKKIKYFCDLKGVKPTVACAESGAGKSFINSIERGSIPSIEKAEQISKYLGCTVSDLLGETAPPTTPEEQQAAQLAAELLKVGVDVRTLSPREMATIARLAKAALDG